MRILVRGTSSSTSSRDSDVWWTESTDIWSLEEVDPECLELELSFRKTFLAALLVLLNIFPAKRLATQNTRGSKGG
jgi:hypothetical protein